MSMKCWCHPSHIRAPIARDPESPLRVEPRDRVVMFRDYTGPPHTVKKK